jgi:ParB-like chromosome segregation protein Spo0J
VTRRAPRSGVNSSRDQGVERAGVRRPESQPGASAPGETLHVRDLTPDPQNRRKHNPRNVGLIADALQKVGAARSIVIDEDGVVLAGNATLDAASEVGIERVRVIEASGHELIAVRRRGLTDAQKRHLAVADNRAAELATWDLAQLAADAEAGLDLSSFFTNVELADLLAGDAPVPDFGAAPEGEQGRLDVVGGAAHTCPECGHTFTEGA